MLAVIKGGDFMFFKRIFTESIAHYSYMIGEGEELIVIDPQPDIDKYLDISRDKSMKIGTILETHRNEDFLAGSRALSEKTGARIYYSGHEDLDYEYGEKIYEGHEFTFNDIKIRALHTPGHTLGHLSYVLYFKDKPYMVFVGDTLFYGSIGRMDFYGEDRIEDMGKMMYDSIFNKLMPLGDDLIMWPAHGPGSACGENTEERPFTTLGYERKHNPDLQYKNEDDFIENNSKMMYKPDYFQYMEVMNLKGIDPIDANPYVNIKTVDELEEENQTIIDIRSQAAFNKAHIPGSIYIDRDSIASFINWTVGREEDLCLVADSSKGLDKIYIDLRRIGYTGEISFLAGGIRSWIGAKKETSSIETVSREEYLENKSEYFILDVRKESEVDEEDRPEKGIIIAMEEISERYEELRGKTNIVTICPSGIRSNYVSSFLKKQGIESKVLIGGIGVL